MTPLIPIALTLFLLFFAGMAGFAATVLTVIARALLTRLRSPRGARPVCSTGPLSPPGAASGPAAGPGRPDPAGPSLSPCPCRNAQAFRPGVFS